MEFTCPLCSTVVSSAPSDVPITIIAGEPGPCCGGLPAHKRPVARQLSRREIGAHLRGKFGRTIPAKVVR
jgi:hypothetical protein